MRLIDADELEELFREVIGRISKRPDINFNMEHMIRASAMVVEMIKDTPTVTPEPHWIPVAEDCECDLMDNEEVLVFQKDGTINGQIRHAMFYDFNGKKKFVTWEEGITIYDVVAYMPLPEPFKGETT